MIVQAGLSGPRDIGMSRIHHAQRRSIDVTNGVGSWAHSGWGRTSRDRILANSRRRRTRVPGTFSPSVPGTRRRGGGHV